jgi:predicted RNase H-like HicB family nuclease
VSQILILASVSREDGTIAGECCCLRGGHRCLLLNKGARRVRWIWYWAILDRERDGFIARIPDLGDLAAYGAVEKDAVAHVAKRAGGHVRALEESGQPVPRPRQASEMPTTLQAKIGRAMISVQVGRPVAKPGSPG